jgi:hypothetical protein
MNRFVQACTFGFGLLYGGCVLVNNGYARAVASDITPAHSALEKNNDAVREAAWNSLGGI